MTPSSEHHQEPVRPRTVPVHRSLSRPILFAGGDRISMGILGITGVALIVATGFTLYAVFAVGVILVAGTWLIQKATKADVQFREIYIRHRWFDDEYGAASDDDAPSQPVHPSVPVAE